MAILMDHLISWMIAVPIIGIGILAFVRDEESVRRVAFGIHNRGVFPFAYTLEGF